MNIKILCEYILIYKNPIHCHLVAYPIILQLHIKKFSLYAVYTEPLMESKVTGNGNTETPNCLCT